MYLVQTSATRCCQQDSLDFLRSPLFQAIENWKRQFSRPRCQCPTGTRGCRPEGETMCVPGTQLGPLSRQTNSAAGSKDRRRLVERVFGRFKRLEECNVTRIKVGSFAEATLCGSFFPFPSSCCYHARRYTNGPCSAALFVQSVMLQALREQPTNTRSISICSIDRPVVECFRRCDEFLEDASCRT